VGALAAMLAVSYIRLPIDLGNKYPFILALQIVFLWALVTSSAMRRPAARLAGAA
jgi:hypothetical protein